MSVNSRNIQPPFRSCFRSLLNASGLIHNPIYL
uniref:Uncharacterized protein n=1 Tax=Anguilla anguilla TaxID=7936 RepID=A0A0E9QNH9_ANGAN